MNVPTKLRDDAEYSEAQGLSASTGWHWQKRKDWMMGRMTLTCAFLGQLFFCCPFACSQVPPCVYCTVLWDLKSCDGKVSLLCSLVSLGSPATGLSAGGQLKAQLRPKVK